MTLVRWNPWTELSSLHSQMDRLFNDSLETFGGTADRLASEYSSLPVDIKQSDDRFIIVASVPGFKPEDVEVTFDDGLLTIRGQRQEEVAHQNGNQDGEWVRRERRLSSTYRQLSLPAEVQADNITANFENGELTITVPRTQKAAPKRIPVAITSTSSHRVLESPSQK